MLLAKIRASVPHQHTVIWLPTLDHYLEISATFSPSWHGTHRNTLPVVPVLSYRLSEIFNRAWMRQLPHSRMPEGFRDWTPSGLPHKIFVGHLPAHLASLQPIVLGQWVREVAQMLTVDRLSCIPRCLIISQWPTIAIPSRHPPRDYHIPNLQTLAFWATRSTPRTNVGGGTFLNRLPISCGPGFTSIWTTLILARRISKCLWPAPASLLAR